ncbi:TIR domain-containing protein [Thauera sp.]|uniref:nSTAND1 domain-containing NTPase n=1 Tax=Thauera sp. TaxID=1905334 RepID=UPI002A36A98E|nr:TIR domain-containing protein [Thauera sp.]MDX9886534.1 TIR domain-containing protein [Thauera sp.]
MSGIFISHSSRDRQAAEEMAARLRAQGYQSLFLDFDPADGIPAGRDWEREIYARLRSCSGVVVLCSAHSMASDWCFAEITHARALGKHLFPVLIGECTLRPLLVDTQVVDLRADAEDGYARLWRGMRGAGLDPADSFAWERGRAPYPGLAPFQAADAAVYFGREQEQRRCLDTLAQMRRYGGERLLVVVGASGSGKSSLVRAGVLPRIARMPDWRVLAPMRPLRQPDEELAHLLLPSQPAPADTPAALGAALASAFAAEPGRPAVLLVVDQLEELVTTSAPEAAARFVQALRAALAPEAGELYCLATLRADYVGALQAHPAWGALPFRQQPLAPMSASHFAEIITAPARVAGLELEDGLVEAVAHDTGSPDALPLLAFTLNRLWRDFGDDRRLTLDEYRARFGGLEGAIRHEAEAVLGALAPAPEVLAALRQAFRQLVRVEPEGGYTRRAARWQDLPAAAHPLLEALVAARLLVSGQEEGGARMLEVAHEALFRAWDQLRRWLDEDRVFLLWRQHALAAAEAWQRAPADTGLLLRGGPLAEARRWQAERADELGETLRAYTDASAAAERRARLRRLGARGGLAVLVLASAALGAGFWQQQREAARQRIDSYWSGALAARDAGDDALRAAHYLARAADLGGHGPARDNALIAIGMLAGGVALAGEITLPGAPDGVRLWTGAEGGAHVPDDVDGRDARDARDGVDGRRGELPSVLLAWRGREAIVYDLADGRQRARFEHPDAVADGLVLAGGAVVTRDAGGGVWLWGKGAPPRALAQGGVARIAGARDGRRLVGWGDDGVRRWDLPEGAPGGHLLAGRALAGAAFVDGGGLLAWSAAGQFWRADAAGATVTWETACAPRGVEVAADGRSAISFCDTALIRHDPAVGRVTARWNSPELIDGVRFDAEAGVVVSWSAGRGRLRVWQAADGAARIERPLDREGSLSRVLLLAGARRLVTAGADGWLETWNLEHGELAARGRHHLADAPVLAAASADGTRVLAWSQATGARLWDAGTLTPLSLPLQHPGRVVGAALDEAGGAILTWADNGSVRLWRRQPALELTAPAAPGADAALPRAQAPDATLKARLDALGLHGYELLDTQGEYALLGAGPLVRRLGPGDRLSPPLALDEGARGGALLDGERVVLWGASSVRLWDAVGGRPLSALLRSDVLFPERGTIDDGLLTADALQARRWRWPLAETGAAGVAAWLALGNATTMDEHGAIRALPRAEWCEFMHTEQRAASGCEH